MKKLVALYVLLLSFSLIAQSIAVKNNSNFNDQTKEWMIKISSDSVLRIMIMEMMLDKTKNDEVEMRKLVNTLMNNPNMQKIMMTSPVEYSGYQNNSAEANNPNNKNINPERNKNETVNK